MRIGNDAKIQMKKNLKKNGEISTKTISCKVLGYQTQKERILLIVRDVELVEISLDAIYECVIWDEERGVRSTGKIRERYQNMYGNVIEFEIENGFYKININSIDK